MENSLYFLGVGQTGLLCDVGVNEKSILETLAKFRNLNFTLSSRNTIDGLFELAVSRQFFDFVCGNLALQRNELVIPISKENSGFLERHIFLGLGDFKAILDAWERYLEGELEILRGRAAALSGEVVLVRQLRGFFPLVSVG